MKTEEDEAFDELARKQGSWGGGFQAKRAAAADKLHWSDCAVHNAPAYPAGECDCDARLSKYAETLLEEATRSCNNIDEQRALDALMREAQPAQEPVAVISAWSLREVYFDVDGEPSMHRSPPQRKWVGLTDEEIKGLWESRVSWTNNNFARAVEQLLKEKNA
jgi:hypothetical protein